MGVEQVFSYMLDLVYRVGLYRNVQVVGYLGVKEFFLGIWILGLGQKD